MSSYIAPESLVLVFRRHPTWCSRSRKVFTLLLLSYPHFGSFSIHFILHVGLSTRLLSGWKPPKSDAEGLPGSSLRPNTVCTIASPTVEVYSYEYRLPRQLLQMTYSPTLPTSKSLKFVGIILLVSPRLLVAAANILSGSSTSQQFWSLEIEAQLLTELGSYPRILASKGLNEHGLGLKYAPSSNLYEYITSEPAISLDQKLRWCKQAAEAVKYIHEKHVIHCDINLRNFLLDDKLDLLLTNFQGMLKSAHGETVLDGLCRECSKSFMPPVHGDYADVKTDIFCARFCNLFHHGCAWSVSRIGQSGWWAYRVTISKRTLSHWRSRMP